ncbi:MAG: ABC-F family ATP-binding cassette domain-containing protein [Actinomycetota bacterium]|nr:ABC-F family ATP-binding cassette domain-containing protein [Actinomycetota bacterium]
MAHLVGAEKISLAYPTRTLLTDVTIGIGDGDAIGVVGRNGHGKSSLMRILARELEPDSGKVTYRNGLRVGYISQSDVPTIVSSKQDVSVRSWLFGDRSEYDYASDPLVREIIGGLVEPIALDASVADLSGGESRRVALAAVLIQDFDLLLLDEPTNHLDIGAIVFLARHLKARLGSGSGALMVITHDRWFLDEVCTNTWEVHDGIVEPFEGGYAAYVLAKYERDRIASVLETKRMNLARKELAWLRRGAPARTSKPKFRIEAANEIISKEPPIRDSVELKALANRRLGRDVIELHDVSYSYDGQEVIRGESIAIGPGDRVGILGVNGAGKSTLLALMTGALAPDSGSVKIGQTVKFGSLTQTFEFEESLKSKRIFEVVEKYRRSFSIGKEDVSVANLLERLGFSSDELATHLVDLSGGQLRRLQILMTLMEEPNVLILDEPTNDMDVDMLTAIEDLLDSWAGTLIMVSHDRYMIERVTDNQYLLIGGKLHHLPRGVDSYFEALSVAAEAKLGGRSKLAPLQSNSSKDSKETSQGPKKSRSKELNNIERKLSRIDEKISRLSDELAGLAYEEYQKAMDLDQQVKALVAEKASLEDEWLELSLED